jgi:hypothetical protein
LKRKARLVHLQNMWPWNPVTRQHEALGVRNGRVSKTACGLNPRLERAVPSWSGEAITCKRCLEIWRTELECVGAIFHRLGPFILAPPTKKKPPA